MRVPALSEIETMDRAALSAAWTDLFNAPVPKSLSQVSLRRFLAFEIQARGLGGLPKGFHAALDRAVQRLEASASPTPAAGGRLLREWNGITHVVEVTGHGFRWNGESYPSLSAVAQDQQARSGHALGQRVTAQGRSGQRRETCVQRGEDGFTKGGHVVIWISIPRGMRYGGK